MYIIILQLDIYLHAKDNSISTDGETADPGVKAIILFKLEILNRSERVTS